jgi:transposase
MLTCLLRIPLSAPPVPAVLGVDDFALRKGHRYATILINAVTRERVDVLPDRKSETLTGWLRAHPGVEVVCRDGAAGNAQAVTDALPEVPQVKTTFKALRRVSLDPRCQRPPPMIGKWPF